MGYPMTYPRVVNRNGLLGNYTESRGDKLTAGDLRRLELDQRDENHLRLYAEHAKITEHQAWLVLTAFFTDFGRAVSTDWLAKPCHDFMKGKNDN